MTLKAIRRAKQENRRIICVGTTSLRALEAAANKILNPRIRRISEPVNIFIYPGYKFKIISNLITNFHLPKSTLLMLVSAIIGRKKTLALYHHAIKNKYRFFSFGDAMFIL
jgi:S-adenosylmethionine:tRNA ribosyltransferase-isomerase